MTGKKLADQFRISVEAVAPGFLDSEVSYFLTQAQFSIIKQLVAYYKLTDVYSKLLERKSILLTRESDSGNVWQDSIVFSGILPNDFLKLISAVVKLNSSLTQYILKCDITPYSYMNRFISTTTNNPFLERPVFFINQDDSLSTTGKTFIILVGKRNFFGTIPLTTEFIYPHVSIDYVRFPNDIDATDDVTLVQFPEFSDEIVQLASKLALDSLYGVQRVANPNFNNPSNNNNNNNDD